MLDRDKKILIPAGSASVFSSFAGVVAHDVIECRRFHAYEALPAHIPLTLARQAL